MTFVDTSAWFAIFVESDRNAQAANRWLDANEHRELVTTDYVIDELLTLMRARNAPDRALDAGKELISGQLTTIEFVSEADFHQAWELFHKFRDKKWSFTDCTSRVVMERLSIGSALAFDEHFVQFGTISVVP